MFIVLLKTFLIIIIGTFSGYIFQNIVRNKKNINAEKQKEIILFLQKLGMIYFQSITYIGSLWIFKMESISNIISIPLVGGLSIVSGGVIAAIYAKKNNYNRVGIGSLFSCGFFSNTASLGGMICFFYLGEEGLALVPLFTFFLRVLYYGFGFPIANIYGNNLIKKNTKEKILEIINDPFFYIGIGAVIIGLYLNLSPYERPKIYKTINELLVPLSTFILLFSVGLNLKFSRISIYLRECFVVSFIKFLIVPFIILVITLLLGYQSINNGLPLKVSLILSTMPVAFNSVIAANIYNLNIDMVNSCWLFTTFAVLLVLPAVFYVINLF